LSLVSLFTEIKPGAFQMTYIALPAARREMPNFGVVALIVLGLISVVIGAGNSAAINAEYQTTPIVLVGP
jgi:hypothetical protein